MKISWLFILLVVFGSEGVFAKQVSCEKRDNAGGVKRTIFFKTQPVDFSEKYVNEDGSPYSVPSLTFLTDGTEKAFVSEFSKNCTVTINEPVVSGETQFLWTFDCSNNVSGKFEMPAPSSGFGVLTFKYKGKIIRTEFFQNGCHLQP